MFFRLRKLVNQRLDEILYAPYSRGALSIQTMVTSEVMMKKTALLVLLAASLVPFLVEAKQVAVHQKLHRLYVQPSDIKISHDGLYVRANGALIPIDRVSRNKNGTYVVGRLLEKETIRCKRCGWIYPAKSHPSSCPCCGVTNA